MSTPQSVKYVTDLYIGNSQRNWGDVLKSFEWRSFLNNGFIIRGRVVDHGFDLLDEIFLKEGEDGGFYLKTARYDPVTNPLLIKYRMRWQEGYSTPWRTALISDMDSREKSGYGGVFEFIAVDPISFYLNMGDASGKCYRGTVGGDNGIIMQVLQDYIPDTIPPSGSKNKTLKVKRIVSPTNEIEANHWMMRQDPKTFIASLVDWSSSLTDSRTAWIVANGEDEESVSISIEEAYTPILRDPAKAIDPAGQQGGVGQGAMIFQYGGSDKGYKADIIRWEMLHDSFIVALNTKLVTGGISAISGEYLDRRTDWGTEKHVYVKDENTEMKPNTKFGADRGYSKPTEFGKTYNMGWTAVHAIPEFNAGDIGKTYKQYMDGRARQIYMGMLNMVMRVKITVTGEPRLYDCLDLGRSQVTLQWLGAEDDEAKFMDGNWMLYGWHHHCADNWTTDVYLARLDYNAEAVGGR